jgi:hypothetical protein
MRCPSCNHTGDASFCEGCMNREVTLLSGTGFSLCVCRHGAELEEKGEYIRQNPVKRALVEHPDSYAWLFTKSITG